MIKHREILSLTAMGTSQRNEAFSVRCAAPTVQDVLRGKGNRNRVAASGGDERCGDSRQGLSGADWSDASKAGIAKRGWTVICGGLPVTTALLWYERTILPAAAASPQYSTYMSFTSSLRDLLLRSTMDPRSGCR